MAKDKTAKTAAKATKEAGRAERQQLKTAQKAEVKALKSAGVSKEGISAEKQANAAEIAALNQALKSGTYTPTTDLTGVRSAAATYSGDVAAQVGSLLDSAAQNYGNYNISTVNKSGNVTTGVGLDKLVDYQLGQAGSKFNELMNRAQTYVGNSFTRADLEAQGVTLKEDKNNPGFYKWSTGADGNKEITYFSQNPDGTFTGAGINRVRTEAQDKGFFDSPLGQIALGVASFYFGVPIGSMLGLGGTTAGLVGGGLLGGTANVLGGGKFFPGALTGALGGFTGAGGFEGLLGTQAAAPVTTIDPLTGQVITSATPSAVSATQAAPSIFDQATQSVSDFFKPAGDLVSRTVNPNEFAFPGIERAATYTPVPGSFQAALPEFGVATQATAAPYTAIPGSFAAATPVLLNNYSSLGVIPSISSAISRLTPAGFPSLPGGFSLPGGISPFDVARLVQPPPPPEEAGGGGFAGANADYSALIAALGAPRAQPRSLV